jgi:N6-L-threonylcarbamoyladenine synthase
MSRWSIKDKTLPECERERRVAGWFVVEVKVTEAEFHESLLHAIAVTQGPGLAGALLVGISYTKALAFALAKPLITVNHLEGHIHAVLLEERQKGNFQTQFPVLALVVSGGHTHLFLAQERANGWIYENIGRTRDDAAGEAYDKVAKLLGLGYPGGPIIDALARHGDPHAVRFMTSQIKHGNRGVPKDKQTAHDFSFSGIKTAVLRYVELEKMRTGIAERQKALAGVGHPKPEDVLRLCDKKTLNLAASFQRTVVNDLVAKTLDAAREREARTLFVAGGVAANSELRQRFELEAAQEGLPVYFPSRKLSTDNAAMIAAAAFPKYLAREFAAPEFSAEASLALQRQ